MSPTNFLSLPAELRNEIYTLIFLGSRDRPTYPWQNWPGMNIAVFLSCRQIYIEASSLLWRDHIQDIVLHFDSRAAFNRLLQQYRNGWPGLAAARFRLRILAPDSKNLQSIAEDLEAVHQLLWDEPYNLSTSGGKEESWHHITTWHCKFPSFGLLNSVSGTSSEHTIEQDTLRTSRIVTQNGMQYQCFTWESWADEDGPGLKTIWNGGKYQRKLTKECMVIEGRIGDVRLPTKDMEGRRGFVNEREVEAESSVRMPAGPELLFLHNL